MRGRSSSLPRLNDTTPQKKTFSPYKESRDVHGRSFPVSGR